MATVPVLLRDGLTVGETVHREAELRETTAADVLDAAAASEQLREVSRGVYELVCSPTLLGLELLRRQVLRIGEHKGPLTAGELKKLSAYDLNLLQAAASALETASWGGARTGEPRPGGEGAPPAP
jgi:phage FluMu protein gp41